MYEDASSGRCPRRSPAAAYDRPDAQAPCTGERIAGTQLRLALVGELSPPIVARGATDRRGLPDRGEVRPGLQIQVRQPYTTTSRTLLLRSPKCGTVRCPKRTIRSLPLEPLTGRFAAGPRIPTCSPWLADGRPEDPSSPRRPCPVGPLPVAVGVMRRARRSSFGRCAKRSRRRAYDRPACTRRLSRSNVIAGIHRLTLRRQAVPTTCYSRVPAVRRCLIRSRTRASGCTPTSGLRAPGHPARCS